MKKPIILSLIICLTACAALYANETFDAPIPAGGKSLSVEKKGTVRFQYEQSTFQEVLDFYKKEVAGLPEIKWHDKEKGAVIIYDWANREWHRINILDEGEGGGVLVEIRKDSWTWIIGTLIIRFVGVFIVLIVLMIALIISGKILPLIKEEPQPKKA